MLKVIRMLSAGELTKLSVHVILRCGLSVLDLLGMYLIGVTVGILSGNTELLVSLSTQLGVDLTLTPNAYTLVAGTAAALFILKGALSLSLNSITAAFVARLTLTKTSFLFDEVTSRSANSNANLTSQEIINGITKSTNSLFGKALIARISLVADTFSIVLVSTYLITVNLGLFILSAISFGLLVYILNFVVSKKINNRSTIAFDELMKSTDTFSDLHRNVRQVLSAGTVSTFKSKFLSEQTKVLEATAALSTLTQIPKVVIESALMVGLGLLVLLRSLSPENFEAAELAVFVAGGFRLVASILPIQSYFAILQAARPEGNFAERILGTRAKENPSTVRSFADAAANGTPLSFKEVSHRFANAKSDSVQGINFEIRSGEIVALVGPSGAGKSTVAELALGFKMPKMGSVEVFGLSTETVESWPPALASYVPQATSLIRGTVYENVTLSPGTPFDKERMSLALLLADCEEFINALPNGPETKLGEGHSLLSGGQIQRLSIARCFYNNSKLVVLDEATSGLDSISSTAIGRALIAMKAYAGVLVIAHSIETIRVADRVLVLVDGKIREHSTYLEFQSSNDFKFLEANS